MGVEVDVVEAGAMEARDQAPGLVPRRAVAVYRGHVGQRAHVEQALHQDRGAVERPLAQVGRRDRPRHRQRPEEHTSELQSIMRISDAVLCMKKTTIKITYKLTTN